MLYLQNIEDQSSRMNDDGDYFIKWINDEVSPLPKFGQRPSLVQSYNLKQSLNFGPKRSVVERIKEPAQSIRKAMSTQSSQIPKKLYTNEVVLNKISKKGKIGRRIFKIEKDNLRFSLAKFSKSNSPKSAIYYNIADVFHIYSGFLGSMSCERYFDRIQISRSEKDAQSKQLLTIFLRDHKTFNFLEPDDTLRSDICNALRILRTSYNASKIFVPREDLLMQYAWNQVQKDDDGIFDKSGMKVLLNQLNLSAKDFFKQNKKKGFKFSLRDCMDHLEKLKIPPLANETLEDQIWRENFGNVDLISRDDFIRFQRNVQKENSVTDEEMELLFEYITRMDIAAKQEQVPEGKINRVQFQCFLSSHYNQAYDHKAKELDCGNSHKPMSYYFINSSHNTYLKGDQLLSHSSVQMYLEALQRGCVCLEIDTWDGWLDDDEAKTPVPVVYHGYTLTSKICFIDVVKCIGGFMDHYKDTFPIILSFENHCSKPYNEVIARNLREVLGDKLYVPPKDFDGTGELPTPATLMGKVIVKGKRPPTPEEVDQKYNKKLQAKNLSKDDRSTLEKKREDEKKLFRRIAPELSEITLIHGVKHSTFDESLTLSNYYMHAISEANHSKLLNESPEMTLKWRQYNTNHMTRAYPKASRVDSSNYSPIIPIAMGCQMTALNFQERCSNMMINDGLFRTNGNCGYVLKPDWLTDINNCQYDQNSFKIHLKILRGSCLPKSAVKAVNPFVKATLHDVDIALDKKSNQQQSPSKKTGSNATLKRTRYKSKPVLTNGFSPFWDDCNWTFTVNNKDIAMLEIRIENEVSQDYTHFQKIAMKKAPLSTSKRIADAVIPVRFLKEGYRSLTLYDQFGQQFTSSGQAALLVEIKFENIK